MDHTGRELDRTRKCLGSRFDLLCLEPDCYLASAISNGTQKAEGLCSAAAEHIATLLWPRDAIATLGNGRIIILLETHSVARSTADFLDDVQRHLMSGFMVDGKEIRTTASIGIARLSRSYQRVGNAVDDAVAALVRARTEGRAHAVKFNAFVDDRRTSINELEHDLLFALERNQFEVYFQPIVSVETGKLDGFEALLRWRHPSDGLKTPGEFLQLLEDTGMMVPTGEWMIKDIASQLKRWSEKTGKMVPVTINLSAEQVESKSIANALIDAVSGSDEVSLLVEVSENTFLMNKESVTQVLASLREQGVRVIVDGLGTGVCCLGYLANLPIDAIKVDAGFADSLTRYSHEPSMMSQIVDLAHSLELDVIGGKVEHPGQLHDAMHICDEVQGFFISHPVDAVTATEMIEADWGISLSAYESADPVS